MHTKREHSNEEIWRGIGPAFNADTFNQFEECYLETVVACICLLKILNKDLTLSSPFDAISTNPMVKKTPVASESLKYLFEKKQ